MLFSKKSHRETIGIDLGTTSVKVLELSQSDCFLIAEGYGYEPLASGVIIDHKINDIEAAAMSVRRAIKKSGSKAKKAAICVPSGNVISKSVSVHSDVSEDELEYLIEIEADKIVPYSLDEINIDFIHMGPSVKNPGENDIQIVVCRKSVVEERVSVIEAAELEAAIVDVDTFTLSRAHALANQKLAETRAGRISAIIDFGASASRFMVFHDNQMIYSRDTSFGGRQLIDDINQKYGMPHNEAMVGLRNGVLPENFSADVLTPYARSLVQEVLRALQFFYSSSIYNTINELSITGGCAQIGNLEKVIEQGINVPTSVLNPFVSARIGSKIDKSQFIKDIPSLGLASGLALRGVE